MNTTRGWWRLTEMAARGLAAPERDAVLGDLAERGPATVATLGDILGLLVRRRVAHWHAWQPWVAGFGIAMPTALVTMGASLALSRTFAETAAMHGVPTALAAVVLRAETLELWSWTCGMSLGALSRKTLGASTVLALLPCLFCISRYHDSALPFASLLLLMPALIGGAIYSRRRAALRMSTATTLACAVSMSVVFVGGVGVWWTWPGWYLVLASRQTDRATTA